MDRVDIQHLRQRAGECKMWCDRFATEADPKASTRSTLLKPSGGMYEVAADPLWPDPYDVSTKRKRKLVEGVAAARSTELTQNGTMENLAVPRWDQMLLCFPCMTALEEAACAASGGLFDEDDVPGWDLWVDYVIAVDDLKEYGRERNSDPSAVCLLCYVPKQLRTLAENGIRATWLDGISWASEYAKVHPESVAGLIGRMWM